MCLTVELKFCNHQQPGKTKLLELLYPNTQQSLPDAGDVQQGDGEEAPGGGPGNPRGIPFPHLF